MKQKDVALIIAIGFVSAVVSLIVSHLVFATPHNQSEQVPVVPAISANFPAPDSRYFNNKSIDPTQLIKTQNNNNQSPFSGNNNSQGQ